MRTIIKQVIGVAILGFAGLTGAVAMAQPYPSKPVHLIVPFPTGGVTDLVGRIIAQRLSERLGQPVVVENKGGAAGAIGAQVAARAAPDGYTLFMGTATHAINTTLVPKSGYDLLKDFAPVSLVASVPLLLAAHPSVPAKDVKDLVALAKQKKGELNFASGSSGSASHLAGEMLKTAAAIDVVHVPYKGGGPAIADLLAGHVTFMFENMPSILTHVQSGKLRGLAVTGQKRSPAAPDLPTMIESGYPGFEAGSWYGVYAPAGTPKEIVQKLNAELVKAINSPEMQRQLSAQGADPVGNTPEEFAAFIRAEIAKWAAVIKAAGVKAE